MRRFLSLGVNSLIAFMVGAIALRILFRFNQYGLPVKWVDDSGSYFKYFTVLSNLVMGLASAVYGIELRLKLCGVRSALSGLTLALKYTATVGVGMTFFVVLFYIGPRSGYKNTYVSANLWLHLIVPLLAMLDYAVLDDEGLLLFGATLLPPLPIALYGLLYMKNLQTNDWYGFAANGPEAANILFAAMFVGAWLLAILLRYFHNGANSLQIRRRPCDY